MKILKKIGKILGGIFGLLVIVVCASLIFGGNDNNNKEYYDVANLKDYKTVKIGGMPEELQNILAGLEKDKGVDAGLEALNLYNEMNFKKDYNNSAEKLKQILNIIETNTKYGNTERTYNYLYEFNEEIDDVYKMKEDKDEKDERIKRKAERLEDEYNKGLIEQNVKQFFSKMIKKAYEQQSLTENNLLPEFKMWDILNYNGYSNIVFDHERRRFTAAPFDNIKELKIGPDVDTKRSVLLLDADYIASTNVNIKYKNISRNITGYVDNNYNVYSLSVPVSLHTYYLSADKQNLTKDMPETGSVLSEKEDAKRAAFFKQEMNDYILQNTFGWKEHALYNKVIYDVLGENNIKILQEKFDVIKDSELRYSDFGISYKSEIGNKNIYVVFSPSFAVDGRKYDLTGNPFDKNGIRMNVSVTISEKNHSKLDDLIFKYLFPKLK